MNNKCKSEISDISNVCKKCGTEFKTEDMRKYLSKPKSNIQVFRILNIEFFFLAVVFSLFPWVSIEKVSFSAGQFISEGLVLAESFNRYGLLGFGLIYRIIQILFVVGCTIYICYDLRLQGKADQPSHIKYSKIVSTIGIIFMSLIIIAVALKFHEIIQLTKYFYIIFVSLCLSRVIAIPKYTKLYYDNRFKENKINSIKENGYTCPNCGTKIEPEKRQRYLIHPRNNIVGHRIYILQFFVLSIVCSLLPWIEVNNEYLTAYGIINLAKTTHDTLLYSIGIIYVILQIAVVVCSFIYLCMDVIFKNKLNKPFHIIFAKWFTTIIASFLVCILVVVAAYIFDIALRMGSSIHVPFSKYFYYTVLLMFVCRCLIIPEYIDGYYQNKRMDALDRKNNKWMFE